MGLGTPLVMGLRILYSQVCNKGGVGMQDVLEPDIQTKIRESLIELLQGPLLRFQRRIVFKQQGTLVIFWDGSLTAFGACAYIVSGGGSNLLTSAGKVIGKGRYTALQSEMAATTLAVQVGCKVQTEMSDTTFTQVLYVGGLQIVCRIIATGRPCRLDVFYGSRLMLIQENTNPRQWAWTPGENNPADQITRLGCKAAMLDTPFWKNGAFLNDGPEEGWPIISCLKINTEIKHLEIKAVSVKVVNLASGRKQ